MKKETKKTTAKTSVDNAEYKLSINLNGTLTEVETNDVSEGLLTIAPPIIKGKVVITLSHLGKTSTRMLDVVRARRVFQNRTSAQIFAKSLLMFLK